MIDWSYTVKDGGKLLLCCSSLSLNDIRISDEAGRTMEAPLLTARVVDGRNEGYSKGVTLTVQYLLK